MEKINDNPFNIKFQTIQQLYRIYNGNLYNFEKINNEMCKQFNSCKEFINFKKWLSIKYKSFNPLFKSKQLQQTLQLIEGVVYKIEFFEIKNTNNLQCDSDESWSSNDSNEEFVIPSLRAARKPVYVSSIKPPSYKFILHGKFDNYFLDKTHYNIYPETRYTNIKFKNLDVIKPFGDDESNTHTRAKRPYPYSKVTIELCNEVLEFGPNCIIIDVTDTDGSIYIYEIEKTQEILYAFQHNKSNIFSNTLNKQ